MKRTPIDQRVLPDYSRNEELMNMITHIVGGALGVSVLVFGVLIGAFHRNPWAIVSAAVYGAVMIWLYAMSSIYHGLRPGRGKKIMQVLDHCTIYALIAATYMPIALVSIRPRYPALGWTIFGCEWGFAALAATFTAIDLKKYKVFSMICYIAMGWFIVIALKPTLEVLPLPGFLLLLAGGVAYTVGAVLYHLGKKRPYFHAVFHIFVVLGSLLQAICILRYVL